MDRKQFLTSNISKSQMKGLEIGPFYNPIAPRREGWSTIIVDYTSGAELRSIAASHSSPYIRTHVAEIEDVDIIWDGRPLDEICRLQSIVDLDFIIASHVIEHMPDLIGFFNQASGVLKKSGVINLAVPDMRRCFDVFKPHTNLAKILQAYRERRTKHSPETMFEAWAYGSAIDGQGAWLKGEKTPPKFIDDLQHSWEKYNNYQSELSSGGNYVDAHAWQFIPSSFALVILELSYLELIDFQISDMQLTEGSEFLVQLVRKVEPMSAQQVRSRRDILARQIQLELCEAALNWVG